MSTYSNDNAQNDPRKVPNPEVPTFSPQAFLEYLVRFIVADDQVRLKDFMFFYKLTHL